MTHEVDVDMQVIPKREFQELGPIVQSNEVIDEDATHHISRVDEMEACI